MISAEVVYNKTFQDAFVCMGDTGSVLCLVIAILLFSKKGSFKNIAKLSFPTVIFNISEIIAFGLSVILNPIFVIPYLLVPVVMCVISYAAVYTGIVPHVVSEVEWTTPIFLSGYLAIGSVAGSILQAVCLAAGVFIYLPFLRLFEEQKERQMVKKVKELTEELQRQEEANAIMTLTGRKDALGGTARVLAEDLKDAIRDKKLFFLYQPQIDTEGHCIGAEALIRWIHPTAGFIYPPLIIQLAKEEKLLHDIEIYMFDEVAQTISEMENEIHTEFKISVNITNESLLWEALERCIAAIRELGESLHFGTIAEYVETEEQKDMLLSLGCDAFQGYYYSKPIPMSELISWMKQHQGIEAF